MTKNNTKNKILGPVMLLITAIIWGCAFVAQSEAMDHMEPFTFQTARSVLGGVVLLPVIAASDAIKKKTRIYKRPTKREKRRTLLYGSLCGIVLFAATMFQQFGMSLGTSSGKAGFITALYILLVPVVGLFFKKKVRPVLWGCIALALAGLYLLCIKDGFTFALSDVLVLCCAVVFTGHIIIVDRFAPGLDGVRLSCVQFFAGAVVSAVFMFIFEKPALSQLASGWISVAYAGIMSSGVAYTLQILGQQRTDPTVASMLMSFESVFAVLGGIVIQHQMPTSKEWIGCALMFVAIIAAQLPERKKAAI